jgi:hypothetical protein
MCKLAIEGKMADRRELADRRLPNPWPSDLHRRIKEKIAEIEADRRYRRRRKADQVQTSPLEPASRPGDANPPKLGY